MSNENPRPSQMPNMDDFDDMSGFGAKDDYRDVGGMANMASMMGMMGMMNEMSGFGSARSRVIEGPDGTRLIFLEQKNIVDEDVDGLDARMKFIGRWLIDGQDICTPDGEAAIGGLGADFVTEEEPTKAWVWFEQPINEALQEKFNNFFDAEFNEEGTRMEISVGAFMSFADSESWDADVDDDSDILMF